jgi:pyridoxine kinase
VGNKAAVFPLQLLGLDVDIINSVQYSNHTGYPCGVEGEVLDGQRLISLIDGMERNGLLAASPSSDEDEGPRIGNILTGYIGSASFLSAVVQIVHKLKTYNPACRYICDPVLGDHGKFYVPIELVHIYKRDVLPIADIITPNQFEIEQLTGITISNIIDAQIACGILHDMGVNTVLITSIVFPSPTTTDATSATTDTIPPPPDDSIAMFASHRNNSKAKIEETTATNLNTNATSVEEDEQYILYTPKLPGQYTGTGDVCAALFLGWTAITADAAAAAETVQDKTDENHDIKSSSSSLLSTSLEKVGGTMHAIVKRTAAAAAASADTTCTSKLVSSRELQLISSRDDIIYPPRLFHAVQVPSLSSTTATPTTSPS